jgi:SAM-dependent methyltransferase
MDTFAERSASKRRYCRVLWTTFFESLAKLEPDDEFVTGRPGGLSPELAGRMADDIATKLNLSSSDMLLDYGSGTGAITRALAPRVSSITAADMTKAVVDRGIKGGGDIEWVVLGDDNPDLGLTPSSGGSFTKLLSYYNAQSFTTHTEVREHIETLCKSVAPGGTVMLGDMPDRERSNQWKSGERGREENRTTWMGRLQKRDIDLERYEANLAAFSDRLKGLGIEAPPEFGKPHPGFDRDIVTRMFREIGGEVTILTQPIEFPNAHTSVDYVVQFSEKV